jgi:hypothetical protein
MQFYSPEFSISIKNCKTYNFCSLSRVSTTAPPVLPLSGHVVDRLDRNRSRDQHCSSSSAANRPRRGGAWWRRPLLCHRSPVLRNTDWLAGRLSSHRGDRGCPLTNDSGFALGTRRRCSVRKSSGVAPPRERGFIESRGGLRLDGENPCALRHTSVSNSGHRLISRLTQ